MATVVDALSMLEGIELPRASPLISALQRVLAALDGTTGAVFRMYPEFNYELAPIFKEDVELLLDEERIDKHRWPFMFIGLASGILDSPRNHALAGHEIGHAIVAIRVAEVERRGREVDAAKRAGKRPPKLLHPLVQIPLPSEKVQKRAAKARGTSIDPPLIEELVTIGVSWLEEHFADSVGVCLFGPAYILAFHDVLVATEGLRRSSSTHPSNADRVLNQYATLMSPRLGYKSTSLPAKIRGRLRAVANQSRVGVSAGRRSKAMEPDEVVRQIVGDLIEPRVAATRRAAISTCKGLLYTRARFAADLARYRSDLATSGIPPMEDDRAIPVELASILNVAHVIANEHLKRFPIGDGDASKESELDKLAMKAIELAEVRLTWDSAVVR